MALTLFVLARPLGKGDKKMLLELILLYPSFFVCVYLSIQVLLFFV